MIEFMSRRAKTLLMTCLLALWPAGVALAQDGGASNSPAGLAMLMLFLGIAGIVGVFVIRWGQSTGDDEESS